MKIILLLFCIFVIFIAIAIYSATIIGKRSDSLILRNDVPELKLKRKPNISRGRFKLLHKGQT